MILNQGFYSSQTQATDLRLLVLHVTVHEDSNILLNRSMYVCFLAGMHSFSINQSVLAHGWHSWDLGRL